MNRNAAANGRSNRKTKRRTLGIASSARSARVSALSILLALVVCVAATSCGRSAPDDGLVAGPASSSTPTDQGEDAAVTQPPDVAVAVPSTDDMAGVRVVSEAQLVTATTAVTAPENATTTSTTAATAASTYAVEPGDTLSVIAERFSVPLSALTEANGIGVADTIKPGQELIIPASG